MARRIYGTGSLWLRKSKRHPAGEFWVRYRDAASRLRAENTHTDSEAKALRLLSRRLGEVQTGTLPSQQAKRTLVEDLAEAHFKMRRVELLRRVGENLPEPTRRWREQRAETLLNDSRSRWEKHLKPVFGHRKAALITTENLDEYISARHATGVECDNQPRALALAADVPAGLHNQTTPGTRRKLATHSKNRSHFLIATKMHLSEEKAKRDLGCACRQVNATYHKPIEIPFEPELIAQNE